MLEERGMGGQRWGRGGFRVRVCERIPVPQLVPRASRCATSSFLQTYTSVYATAVGFFNSFSRPRSALLRATSCMRMSKSSSAPTHSSLSRGVRGCRSTRLGSARASTTQEPGLSPCRPPFLTHAHNADAFFCVSTFSLSFSSPFYLLPSDTWRERRSPSSFFYVVRTSSLGLDLIVACGVLLRVLCCRDFTFFLFFSFWWLCCAVQTLFPFSLSRFSPRREPPPRVL